MERTTTNKTLRMTVKLRDWIETQARMNGRSVNSEICHRLERTRWIDDPASRPPELQGGAPAAGQASQA